IWHQVFVLDDGERLGKAFFQFRGAVCQPEQVGPTANHVRWVDKPFAEEAVAQMIADISIRHEFAEVMKGVPENHSQSISYELKPKHMRAYRELEKNATLQLEAGTVSAVNAAVLRTKLLQVASGAVYSSEGEYAVLDTGRYELILDLVEARKHSIVFFNWHHQKAGLLAEAEKRGISYALIDGTTSDKRRAEIREAYQAGFYQTLLLHPKTGAHGLTLTKGTAVIWSSPVYEADFLKQGKHRIYRAGQTERTETLLVEAAGTVEGLVYRRLGEKTARMVNLLDVLKSNAQGGNS
ncbi:MAG: helicase-related protein, partial [bacterium]